MHTNHEEYTEINFHPAGSIKFSKSYPYCY
jgi:hypothetical protein